MTAELQLAIEGVYAAFASVPKPREITGCPCCIAEKQVTLLLAKPRREISADELSSYASSVFLTVGDVADFRYFLPRILEIGATDPGWWPDPEVIGRALHDAGWTKWPAEERAAVVQLIDVVFDLSVLAADGSALDSWLCAIARCGVNIMPYLAKVATSRPAILALYEWNAGAISRHTLANGFWDDCADDRRRVIEWFYDLPASLVILEAYGVDLYLPGPDHA